jgi:nickel-type superoxide dismutase maturation protease
MRLPDVSLKERLMLMLGRRRLVKVEGDSMLPTLRSGDIVLVDPKAVATAGDIVVANHPFKKSVKLIKRVESVETNGRMVLTGDNPEGSTDSRTYGSIAKGEIGGKVVGRYKN